MIRICPSIIKLCCTYIYWTLSVTILVPTESQPLAPPSWRSPRSPGCSTGPPPPQRVSSPQNPLGETSNKLKEKSAKAENGTAHRRYLWWRWRGCLLLLLGNELLELILGRPDLLFSADWTQLSIVLWQKVIWLALNLVVDWSLKVRDKWSR